MPFLRLQPRSRTSGPLGWGPKFCFNKCCKWLWWYLPKSENYCMLGGCFFWDKQLEWCQNFSRINSNLSLNTVSLGAFDPEFKEPHCDPNWAYCSAWLWHPRICSRNTLPRCAALVKEADMNEMESGTPLTSINGFTRQKEGNRAQDREPS